MGGVTRFAKLFDRDGDQVLVTKDKDDDGSPMLRFRFKSKSGHTVTTGYGFDEGDWESRDKAFDLVDESMAYEVRDESPAAKL